MPLRNFLLTRLNKGQISRLNKAALAFASGAALYSCAELLWRGHTHWTMTVTGGLCVMLIHIMNRRMRHRPIALRCLGGCFIITLLEFSVGVVVNRLLGWNVWDYSSMRFNLLGQICLLYCGMWYLLSLPAIALSTLIDMPRRSAIVFR